VVGALSDQEMIATVALKATCILKGSHLAALPLDKSWPVFEIPLEVGGVLFEPELYYARRMIDIHVFGTACALGGKETNEMRVSVSSGRLSYNVDVIGDRVWKRNPFGHLVPSAPIPFTVMSLKSNRAFGGTANLDGLATPFPENPEGCGFYTSKEMALNKPLPNLELPDQRIHNWNDTPTPACFLKAPSSSLGMEKAFVKDDDGIIKEITPYLFQRAVPFLIATQDMLGSEIRLSGFSPDGEIVYPLPQMSDFPQVHVTSGSRRSAFRLNLSTITILADIPSIVLTFMRSFRYLLDKEGIDTIAEMRWDPAWVRPYVADRVKTAVLSAMPMPMQPAPQPVKPSPVSPPANQYLFEAQPDPDGPKHLFLAVQRTYVMLDGGTLQVAEEQLPLPSKRVDYDDVPDGTIPSCKILPEGIYRPQTDVIVRGTVYTYGSPARVVEAGIRIGERFHMAHVSGSRVCRVHERRIVFTEPEFFEAMPLRYENAYGGRDRFAEKCFLDAIPERSKQKIIPFLPVNLEQFSPFVYPRNPAGKGFVICEDLGPIDGLELPNLEDPNDLLTPGRLICGGLHRWVRQPLPVGFGPVNPIWFPRIAMLGCCPVYQPQDVRFPEIERSLLPQDFIRPHVLDLPSTRYAEAISPLAAQSASLGLSFPYLKGSVPIKLINIHPDRPDYSFCLPDENPSLRVTYRGKEYFPEPEIYSVIIEPDDRRISVVWCGGFPVPRPSQTTEIEEAKCNVDWA